MEKSTVKKSSIKSIHLNYILIFIAFLYFLSILFYYISFDADNMFGYLDYQIHWQSQYDLVAGKILYRDFYWEYGFLILFLRIPIFFLLGKTFYSSYFNDFIFLPLLGVALSLGIAKQYLNKKSLIIFLILMLLYRLNTDFNTVRHLIPELGLITIIIGTLEQNLRKKLIGSFILGVSLISSVEYALIANISYVIFFVLYIFKTPKAVLKNIFQSFSFQIGIGLSFLFYLIKFNILENYIRFHMEFIKAFYTSSPDRLLFPRWDNLGQIFQNSNGFVFNFFVLIQQLNIYMLVPIVIFLIIWNIQHRHSKWFLLNITLIIYSIFAYSRSLTTPGYVGYGLTFIILMISSLFSHQQNSRKIKIIVVSIIVWLCCASGFQNTLHNIYTFSSQPRVEKEFLPIAGMYLSKPLAVEYKRVSNYIIKNTTPSDYVYVFPDGPYNQLVNRKSPVPITTTDYYGLVPSLVETVYQHMAANKPKYIIINKYNSSSYISNINGASYNVYAEGKDILIDGITTKIEDYIQQHYDLVKKSEIAWILKRSNKEKPLKKIYVPVSKEWHIRLHNLERRTLLFDDEMELQVTDTNPEIIFLNDNFNDINMFTLPINIDIGLIKPVSKFIFQIGLIDNQNRGYIIKNGFVASDWQDVIVKIPQTDPPLKAKGFFIKVLPNKGFLFWGMPNTIKFKSPIAYTINKELHIDDSVLK